MDQFADPGQHVVNRYLLTKLLPLIEHRRDAYASGIQQIGNQLVTYCVFERERLVEMQTEFPLIGIVLSGEKQLWYGDVCHRLSPGEAFVFPGNVKLTVVNIPDERFDRYESLIIEVPDPASPEFFVENLRRHQSPQPKLRLTQNIAEALVHAAQLRAGSSKRLAAHRLTEVLMLIADQPAAAPLFDTSAASAVAGVVRGEPSRDWTATAIGVRLGVGGSTLRRRLVREGASLREVIRETRMSVAHELLSSGSATVSQAASSAGYTSRSHFARAFRAAYGMEPRRALPN